MSMSATRNAICAPLLEVPFLVSYSAKIAYTEIEAETTAVERHGTIEVRNSQHNGHETVRVLSHQRILPLGGGGSP
jgi:hypothetical protein